MSRERHPRDPSRPRRRSHTHHTSTRPRGDTSDAERDVGDIVDPVRPVDPARTSPQRMPHPPERTDPVSYPRIHDPSPSYDPVYMEVLPAFDDLFVDPRPAEDPRPADEPELAYEVPALEELSEVPAPIGPIEIYPTIFYPHFSTPLQQLPPVSMPLQQRPPVSMPLQQRPPVQRKLFLGEINCRNTPITALLLVTFYSRYLDVNDLSRQSKLVRKLPIEIRKILPKLHYANYYIAWLEYSRLGTRPRQWPLLIGQFVLGTALVIGIATAIGAIFGGGHGAVTGLITGAVIGGVLHGTLFIGDAISDWAHTAYQNAIAKHFDHKMVSDCLESFERLGRLDVAIKYLIATSYSMVSRYSFWISMLIRVENKRFQPKSEDIKKLFELAYAHKKASEDEFLKLYKQYFLKLYTMLNIRLAKHQRALYNKYCEVFSGKDEQSPYEGFIQAVNHFVKKEGFATDQFAPIIAKDFVEEFIGIPNISPAPAASLIEPSATQADNPQAGAASGASAAAAAAAASARRADNPQAGAASGASAAAAAAAAAAAGARRADNPQAGAASGASAASAAAAAAAAGSDGATGGRSQLTLMVDPEMGEVGRLPPPVDPTTAGMEAAEAAIRAAGQMLAALRVMSERQQAHPQQSQGQQEPRAAQQPAPRQQGSVSATEQASSSARPQPQRPQAPYTAPPSSTSQQAVASAGTRQQGDIRDLPRDTLRALGGGMGLPLNPYVTALRAGEAAQVRTLAPSAPLAPAIQAQGRSSRPAGRVPPRSNDLPSPQPARGPLLTGPSAQLVANMDALPHDVRVRQAKDVQRVLPTREPIPNPTDSSVPQEDRIQIENMYRAFARINSVIRHTGERPATLITLIRAFGDRFLGDAEAIDINRRLGAGNQMLLFVELSPELRPTPLMVFTRVVLAFNSICTKLRDWSLDHHMQRLIKEFDGFFWLCIDRQDAGMASASRPPSAAPAVAPVAPSQGLRGSLARRQTASAASHASIAPPLTREQSVVRVEDAIRYSGDAIPRSRDEILNEQAIEEATHILSLTCPLDAPKGKLSVWIKLPTGKLIPFQKLADGKFKKMLLNKFANANGYPKILQIMYRNLLEDISGLTNRLLLQEAAFAFQNESENTKSLAAAYLDNCLSLFKIVGRLYYVRAILEFYAQMTEHSHQKILDELHKITREYAIKHGETPAPPDPPPPDPGWQPHWIDEDLNKLRRYMVDGEKSPERTEVLG